MSKAWNAFTLEKGGKFSFHKTHEIFLYCSVINQDVFFHLFYCATIIDYHLFCPLFRRTKIYPSFYEAPFTPSEIEKLQYTLLME